MYQIVDPARLCCRVAGAQGRSNGSSSVPPTGSASHCANSSARRARTASSCSSLTSDSTSIALAAFHHSQPIAQVGRGDLGALVTLEVEQADDGFGRLCVRGDRPSRPRRPEVGEIPPLRHQTEEAAAMAEHGLDRVMRQIVSWKELSAPPFLALPRARAVGAHAAQRSASVRALLDSDQQVGHADNGTPDPGPAGVTPALLPVPGRRRFSPRAPSSAPPAGSLGRRRGRTPHGPPSPAAEFR